MIRLAPVLGAIAVALVVAVSWSALSAQQAGTIRITSPANGSTVNGPVSVTVEIGNVTVRPAAEGDPNAFHYHLFVDVDPAAVVQPGQPIPLGQANIIHTADRTVSIPNLAPGNHTLVAVLTRTDHVPLSPAVQERITFTVGAAGQAPAQATATAVRTATAAATATAGPGAPRVGAGVSTGAAQLPAIAIVLAVVGFAGGALLIRRRASS